MAPYPSRGSVADHSSERVKQAASSAIRAEAPEALGTQSPHRRRRQPLRPRKRRKASIVVDRLALIGSRFVRFSPFSRRSHPHAIDPIIVPSASFRTSSSQELVRRRAGAHRGLLESGGVRTRRRGIFVWRSSNTRRFSCWTSAHQEAQAESRCVLVGVRSRKRRKSGRRSERERERAPRAGFGDRRAGG